MVISCALGCVICCITLFGGLLVVVCGACFGLGGDEFVWLWDWRFNVLVSGLAMLVVFLRT